MPFGVADAIAAGMKVLDKFIPDPAERARAETQLRADLLAWDKTQTDVNAVEAQHDNVFVAGWRPAIGWSCAFAFGFNFVLGPIIAWGSTLVGYPVPLPTFNHDALMSMTLGMLGIAGMRSWEKYKGLTK